MSFGFFTAKVVVQLGKPEFIQAAVLLHPSFVSVDDIKGKNYTIVLAEALELFWSLVCTS